MTEEKKQTWIDRLNSMDGFEYIILPLLYFEEFVKRSLMGIYKTIVSVDNWNFNRTLDKRNQELYKQTPKPKSDND